MAKKPAYRAGRDQAATAENVELLTGQRGDRLDKAVTFRELAALGLSTLRPGAGGAYVPGKNPDLFPVGQMEFPHAPVNVIANGAFHTVLVEWDPPQYRGHAHAEIWRAESNNQSDATLVGTSSANLFSDAIGKGATFYYWVRFVNGKDDRGPFQGMQGVEAETSRDVQDILDELQGKIEKSHLVQSLLKPIEDVPQLQLDVSILKPKVDEIEIRIPGIEQELAGLDERQKAAQDLLDDAQQQLGNSSIEIGLVQDRLNAKLDKYKGDFDSFRDAVFVVDPENGSITMDAVNAVRNELHTSITEVHQDLDAVAGQITSKADNVTVDGQGKRITEAEQRINGLDASLSQTVTKGEFTEEQKKVTEIGQELNATKGELSQKATQQEVDAHGERLANAESKLTAHTDELSSQAQRLDGLAAQVTLGDATLQANITELARVTAESDQVTAQRVSGLEVRAGTSEAKIQALEEIIEDDGGITAGRFDTIMAELELQRGLDDDNSSAAIDGALAVDEHDRETRKAFGAIRTEQRVILTEQQAQAQHTTDMKVKFEANAAAVQLQSQAIADLQNGAQAMWTAKASAGQITAGIGLIANSDGTSQVAISASQVFVFNPNSSTPMAPLFAIDNGQVVIAEAIIRKATIQIIHSEKITADHIKAGVSISSPLINGGQIDMGNAFMAGGAAGFGKGGPYGGWGWGWHSIIYSDGSIYTNRLNAEGGYVRNMTIGNCTIEQDCVVKGTVYADRIVGDVAAIKSLYMQKPSGPFSMFFNVVPANFARGIIVTGINIKAEGYYYGSGGKPLEGTSTCTVVFYMNGVEFGRESVSATGGSRKDSATASATVTLPAGVYGQFQVSILGDVSVSLTGAVAMVFKHGSATFG